MKDQLLFRTKHRGAMLILGIVLSAGSFGLQFSQDIGIFNTKHKNELLRRFKPLRTGRRKRKDEYCYE